MNFGAPLFLLGSTSNLGLIGSANANAGETAILREHLQIDFLS